MQRRAEMAAGKGLAKCSAVGIAKVCMSCFVYSRLLFNRAVSDLPD
jgi:hypothetical protein